MPLIRTAPAWLIALMSACGGSGSSKPPAELEPPSLLIVGVDADAELRSRIGRLEMQMESPIGTLVDAVDTADALPLEWPLPATEPRALVRVVIRAFDDGDELLLERVAHTNEPEERTALLRVRLNDECLPGVTGRSVACGEADTCVAGFCGNPHINESSLDDYDPSWAELPSGDCVDDANLPFIEIGNDGEPFTLMADGTAHVPEWGIQGGTHIWFSVRANNLAPVGGITYAALDSMDGALGNVQKTDDDFVAGTDGCVLQRARYILAGPEAYETDMRLHVTVADYTGNAAHASVDLYIDDPPPPP